MPVCAGPLLTHPEATELLSHLLGEHYNLSTGFVKIVKPGAEAEALHTDRAPTAAPPHPLPAGHSPPAPAPALTVRVPAPAEWWFPPPQVRERGPSAVESQPEIRTGSITRELATTPALHSGANVVLLDSGDGERREVSLIPPCCANQAVFCASDFTEHNGATLLVRPTPQPFACPCLLRLVFPAPRDFKATAGAGLASGGPAPHEGGGGGGWQGGRRRAALRAGRHLHRLRLPLLGMPPAPSALLQPDQLWLPPCSI
eukprot:COSAG04_NODE_86_length_27446_cov_79.885046_28_plen_258_part_00